jgi:uncharacterized protein (DUF302 family)
MEENMQMQAEAIGFGLTIQRDFDSVLIEVTESLKEEGFGILTEIDAQATFKKKLDVDFNRYKILGACNPRLAHRALTAHPTIGLLLPCNVTVSENDKGDVDVFFVDPMVMMSMVDNPALEPIAEEAKERLERVAATLEE